MLDEALASRLATIALDNVVREFPNKLDHLMSSAADVERPAVLHPVFYGSYDWHSSVHMHWTLVRLLARFPRLPEAESIATRLDAHVTEAAVAAECAYLARPGAASFERPYGWAWLLKLSEALHRAARDDPRAAAWRDRLQPLADAFVDRVVAFLPRAVHPSRAGTHANSAFAVDLMLDYAIAVDATPLRDALVAKAASWFAADRDYPVAYETGSEDFLSNGLQQAVLMRRVLAIDGRRRRALSRLVGRLRSRPGADRAVARAARAVRSQRRAADAHRRAEPVARVVLDPAARRPGAGSPDTGRTGDRRASARIAAACDAGPLRRDALARVVRAAGAWPLT